MKFEGKALSKFEYFENWFLGALFIVGSAAGMAFLVWDDKNYKMDGMNGVSAQVIPDKLTFSRGAWNERKKGCHWRQLNVGEPSYRFEWQLFREPDGMLMGTVRQEGVQLGLYRVEGGNAFETLGGAKHEAEEVTNCEVKG